MMRPQGGERAVGVLGGTFDPIHFGHLHLAETARAALDLSRVLFIPAGNPPHRQSPAAAGAHRLEMVRLATAGNPAFEVDAAEVESPAPSYSVTTLRRLRAALGPSRPLVLLLGVDAFLGLPGWHEWSALFGLAHIAVANRPGYQLPHMPAELAAQHHARQAPATALQGSPAGKITTFDITPLAISATGLRAQIAAGRPVRYLCPDAVLDYIHQHQLYR